MKHLDTSFFFLKNQIQEYPWGSHTWIHDLLEGIEHLDSSKPAAELWMGMHPKAPSLAMTGAGLVPLGDLIQSNPDYFIGASIAKSYGTLPFLFKILAAEKPLSIQAHPNLIQAQEGFTRENQAGIPLSADNRNYKDPNHKPEIICALTPFTAMCGFRPIQEIVYLFSVFEFAVLQSCLEALSIPNQETAYRNFLQQLFALTAEQRHTLYQGLQKQLPLVKMQHPSASIEWDLVSSFMKLFPEDPTVLAPLYLNVMTLHPGQAIFLPAGILHAYVHGLGVELMANSDNVLRGGLTNKYIDTEELLRILRFEPYRPEISNGATDCSEQSVSYRCYPCPVPEFQLFSLHVSSEHPSQIPREPGKPSILIITEGKAQIHRSSGVTSLEKGQSMFIPACATPLEISGTCTLYGATTGTLEARL
ncbi:MAG: mannose-6-phosphate isomerase, class I [Termitinemataceae bacterium]